MAFISHRSRLPRVLAGSARGGKGNKGVGGRLRFPDVDTQRQSGFKYKLICCFKLAVDMVRGGIRDYVLHRCFQM